MGMYGRQYEVNLGGGGLSPAVKYLILTNVGFFFIQYLILSKFRMFGVVAAEWFMLVPDWVVHKGAIWQLVTYMFMHGPPEPPMYIPWHILSNMLILWMIGVELERYWGTRDFVLFYFACGIGAGLIHLLVSFAIDIEWIKVIGASGAIFGLLIAFGMLFPNRVITLLLMFILPINIKVKYLVMVFGLLAFIGALSSPGGPEAHFAHLGGMLVGFLYLQYVKPSLRWGDIMFSNRSGKAEASPLTKWFRQRTEKRRQMQVVRRRQQEVQLRERVDVILDKINEVGYENLSEDEKQILKKASQYLSQKNLHSEGLS